MSDEQEARDYADAAMRKRWPGTDPVYRKKLVNFIIDRYREKLDDVQPSLFGALKVADPEFCEAQQHTKFLLSRLTESTPFLKEGGYIEVPAVKWSWWNRLCFWRKRPPTIFQVKGDWTVK